jgi:hypothetical protein
VNKRTGLAAESCGHTGMAMAQIAYGDTGGEIQIFCTVGIPQAASLTTHKKLLGGISWHDIGFDSADGFFVKFTHDKIKLLNNLTIIENIIYHILSKKQIISLVLRSKAPP